MAKTVTVRGRISNLEVDHHSFIRATVNVGEFQTLSEQRITGYLVIVGLPPGSPDWQLGQMVTITVTQEAT